MELFDFFKYSTHFPKKINSLINFKKYSLHEEFTDKTPLILSVNSVSSNPPKSLNFRLSRFSAEITEKNTSKV